MKEAVLLALFRLHPSPFRNNLHRVNPSNSPTVSDLIFFEEEAGEALSLSVQRIHEDFCLQFIYFFVRELGPETVDSAGRGRIIGT